MKSTKSIELIIGAKGELRIEGHGFKGMECEKATAFLEKALGEINSRQRKPEYLASVRRKHRQEIGR